MLYFIYLKGSTILSLSVDSSLMIVGTYNNVQVTSNTAITTGTWTLITAYFGTEFWTAGNRGVIILYFDNQIQVTSFTPITLTTSYVESNKDIFRIGGFIGKIKNFKIYSPGTAQVDKCKKLLYYLYIHVYFSTMLCMLTRNLWRTCLLTMSPNLQRMRRRKFKLMLIMPYWKLYNCINLFDV
jgi:hypothetical protein